ncbi:MAG: homogentisate 1,2-dioxygenase [Gammaproteobacteria bacterium]|nr:homogentisate 1,2-dioxygenase [Gammaproteobacteria bacterium]
MKPHSATEPAAALGYQAGFGNEHQTEALPGALPVGRFSPQKCPYGLYAEKLSGTAFTVARAHNLRAWLYRIRPSAQHGGFRPLDNRRLRGAPITEVVTPPDQMRWDPLPIPASATDFVDGLTTLGASGDLSAQTGIGIHLYLANTSMQDRFFYDADGDLLLVPQQGRVRVHTECGVLDGAPGEILLVPRGMKFRVVLPDGAARGYVCENYGAPFRLPERGPVGSDGYANQRDFMAPVAAYEDREGAFELACKFGGQLYACDIGHSPLDVVAWAGNYTPYKYDLARFNAMGTVTYDHPDPSIYTVMTSASDTPGVANCDFVIFPPRWMVAEDTFRPPWYHRNVMNEFMGLIYGTYDAKPTGFVPGGASLHNCMTPHGPDDDAFQKASNATLGADRYAETMAFMFETRYLIRVTRLALEAGERQRDYIDCWKTLRKQFNGKP